MANFAKGKIREQIEATADYYPAGTYAFGSGGEGFAPLLTFFKSLQVEADPLSSDFIPLSAVAQQGRNPKLFAIGLLPPTQQITGRLLDRSASIASLPVRDLTGSTINTQLADSGGAGVYGETSEVSQERLGILDAANSQLGQSDWTKYVGVCTPTTPAQRVSWCGVFATWSLQQAGYDVHWELGKGIRPQLPQTTNPKPGDIAYFGGDLHHYAIVESFEGNRVNTIDGNSKGRKVCKNSRPRSEVVAYFSVAGLQPGLSPGNEIPAPCPVGYDANNTATWQSQGEDNAELANKYQAKLSDTDIQVQGRVLSQQMALVKAIRNTLQSMANTPPLRMLVNPSKFAIKSQKIVQNGSWTRNGPVIEYWGDDQDKISGSGKVAGFYSILANPGLGQGGPGLTRTARNFSQSWQNFQALWLLYKNNGGVYLEDLASDAKDLLLSTVGSVYIYYDNILYIGSFDSFNLTEADDRPFTADYSFEFTVRASFLLEYPDDLNYGADAALFTQKQKATLPTTSGYLPPSRFVEENGSQAAAAQVVKPTPT